MDAYKADSFSGDLSYSEAAANKDIEDMHMAAIDSIINLVGVDCAAQWGLLSLDTAQNRDVWNKFVNCNSEEEFKNLIFSLQLSSILNESNNHMYLSKAVKAEDGSACKQALINSMTSLMQGTNGNPIVHAFITMSFININGRYDFDNGFNYEDYIKAVKSLDDDAAVTVAKGLLSAMNAFTDVSENNPVDTYETKVALLNNLYYGRETDIPEISWMSWAAAGMHDEIEMSSFQNKIKKAKASLHNKNVLSNIKTARDEVDSLMKVVEQDNNEYSLQDFLLHRSRDIHINTFKRAGGLYQLYATMAQRVQADKGKVTPGADVLYQSALMATSHEYHTIADELTLAMSDSEMTAETFQRNRYAMLRLICDPTYSIYVEGYGPEPLTMERFYKETSGIELNGLMPSNKQIGFVLRRYPQLVSWIKDMSMVPTTNANGGVSVSMLGDGSETLVASYNKYKNDFNSNEDEYLELEADRLLADSAAMLEIGAGLTDLTGHEMNPNEILHKYEESNEQAAKAIKWLGSALHNKTISNEEDLRRVISKAVYKSSFKHVLGLSEAFTYVSFDDRIAQTVNEIQNAYVKDIDESLTAGTIADDLSKLLDLEISTKGTKYESIEDKEIDDVTGAVIRPSNPQETIRRIAYLTNPNYTSDTYDGVGLDPNFKADMYLKFFNQAWAKKKVELRNNVTWQDQEDFKAEFKKKFDIAISNAESTRAEVKAIQEHNEFVALFEGLADDMLNATDMEAVEERLINMLNVATGAPDGYKSYLKFSESDVKAIYEAIQSSDTNKVKYLSKIVIGKSLLRHITTRYGIETNWEYEVEAEQIIDLIVEGAVEFNKGLTRVNAKNEKLALGDNIANLYDVTGSNPDLAN